MPPAPMPAGTGELIVEAQGGGWHLIRSNIVGSGMAFVKTGSGTIQLEGVNTYDGGTYVDQGTLVISPWNGGGRIPLAGDRHGRSRTDRGNRLGPVWASRAPAA